MAFNVADWSITRNGGALDVRYIGDTHAGASPSYTTTIELHRALADFADNEVDSGDDELSIIDQTPSDRGGADTNITLLNGCNLDDSSVEYIYDGSITQDTGDTIYDGIQTFGNSDSIQVIQNGAIIANDFWNEANMKTAVSDSLSSTTHRFLIKVRTGGADIDGRRLLGTQRVLGTVYTEFFIGGGTNRGNNVFALTANSDGNNQTAEGTISGYTDIVNDSEGYVGIDADGNTADEFYYSNWELGTRSKNDFYERSKWIQREGSSETIYGIAGDIFRGITHEIDIDTATGTFVEPESLSWAGGAAQLLAIDSVTAGTKMWVQILSGVAPTDGQTITGNGGGTADVNVTVTPRLIPSTFAGTSTGSAINPGAFGIGIGADDLTQNDLLVDLTNTNTVPPNNVVYTVSNTVAGDYVVSANNNAGDFDLSQLSTNVGYSGATVTSMVMTASIPTDIPSSGTFRVQLTSGKYRRVAYTSFTGATFTVTSIDFTGDVVASGANAFVTYIDRLATGSSETATFVFDSNRTLFTRVRNATGGSEIKTFETTSLVGSGGGSSTVGRINDF
tara:strand:- start:282 stop:1970 length:1689 start_codon:yes stop_codon:yes gene_type:complete